MRAKFLSMTGLVLAACTTLQHGTVTGRTAGGDAEVALGSADGVKAGSRINFLENRCGNDVRTLGEQWKCKPVTDGTGVVVEVAGEHKAVVKPDAGTRFRWTQHVEVDTEGAH